MESIKTRILNSSIILILELHKLRKIKISNSLKRRTKKSNGQSSERPKSRTDRIMTYQKVIEWKKAKDYETLSAFMGYFNLNGKKNHLDNIFSGLSFISRIFGDIRYFDPSIFWSSLFCSIDTLTVDFFLLGILDFKYISCSLF